MQRFVSNIKLATVVVSLVGFLLVNVFSLVHMVHMNEMHMPMNDCPYMAGEHSLCSMDVLSHIKTWQQFSSVTISPIVFLIFQVSSFTFLFVVTYPAIIIFYKNSRYRWNRIKAFLIQKRLSF
jgi:hypothetical protein